MLSLVRVRLAVVAINKLGHGREGCSLSSSTEPDWRSRDQPQRPANAMGGSFCETDSGRVRGATQFLKLEQHREHAFELSIEMNLVAGKTVKPIGIDGFAICLGAD